MKAIKYENYNLSYDEDNIIIEDKVNNKIKYFYFGKELNDLEIIGNKTNVNLEVNSFFLKSKEDIVLLSDRNIHLNPIVIEENKVFEEFFI